MAYSENFVERSAQDRRSGMDRRMEQVIIERLDRFGITLSAQSLPSNREVERRRNERRKGERRLLM